MAQRDGGDQCVAEPSVLCMAPAVAQQPAPVHVIAGPAALAAPPAARLPRAADLMRAFLELQTVSELDVMEAALVEPPTPLTQLLERVSDGQHVVTLVRALRHVSVRDAVQLVTCGTWPFPPTQGLPNLSRSDLPPAAFSPGAGQPLGSEGQPELHALLVHTLMRWVMPDLVATAWAVASPEAAGREVVGGVRVRLLAALLAQRVQVAALTAAELERQGLTTATQLRTWVAPLVHMALADMWPLMLAAQDQERAHATGAVAAVAVPAPRKRPRRDDGVDGGGGGVAGAATDATPAGVISNTPNAGLLDAYWLLQRQQRSVCPTQHGARTQAVASFLPALSPELDEAIVSVCKAHAGDPPLQLGMHLLHLAQRLDAPELTSNDAIGILRVSDACWRPLLPALWPRGPETPPQLFEAALPMGPPAPAPGQQAAAVVSERITLRQRLERVAAARVAAAQQRARERRRHPVRMADARPSGPAMPAPARSLPPIAAPVAMPWARPPSEASRATTDGVLHYRIQCELLARFDEVNHEATSRLAG